MLNILHSLSLTQNKSEEKISCCCLINCAQEKEQNEAHLRMPSLQIDKTHVFQVFIHLCNFINFIILIEVKIREGMQTKNNFNLQFKIKFENYEN
jgi:hypothetical protein